MSPASTQQSPPQATTATESATEADLPDGHMQKLLEKVKYLEGTNKVWGWAH